MVQGKRAEARAAFKAALDKAEPGPLSQAVRLKLEALGEG